MVYDTLKLAEQLEHEAGFDASRARSLARILADNTGGNLATREDLLLTREDILLTKGELKTEIQGVRSELQRAKSELKADIQEVKGHIRLLYWMVGTTLTGVTAILGIAIGIALHTIHLQ